MTPKHLEGLDPHELLAVTHIDPLPEPTVTVIEVEVDEPLQPAGNDQVYEIAPDTEEML